MSKYLLITIILLTFATWIVGSSYPMTRGKSVAPSTLSMTGITKKTDIMAKKSTTEEFVAKAEKKHPNIDFSKVRYVNVTTDVSLVCKKCGLEWETMPNTILNGSGCPHCSRTKLILGVGINDVPLPAKSCGEVGNVYRTWHNMLKRCYDTNRSSNNASYVGCSVCDEWLFLSNFKKWYEENYIEGYVLDKDILAKGNKVYSPQTCCFVPAAINDIITRRREGRKTAAGVGVVVEKGRKKKYVAKLYYDGIAHILGCFDTSEEASRIYKHAKEEYIRSVAEKYFREGKITERVYNALMNYTVKIDV